VSSPYAKINLILTYNELDHSLRACLPACRYQLTSNTITTADWKKDRVGYLDIISFSSESL
jgi:hypothetical protein